MPLTCYRCDLETEADLDDIPAGWEMRESVSLGQYPVCPQCAQKDAPRVEKDVDGKPIVATGAQTRLRSIIERVERLEEDEAVLRADKKEIYEEAKSEGFDVKILRMVVRERRKDPTVREEEQAMFDLYASEVGLQ